MGKTLIGLTTYGIANAPGYNIPAEYVLAIELLCAAQTDFKSSVAPHSESDRAKEVAHESQ